MDTWESVNFESRTVAPLRFHLCYSFLCLQHCIGPADLRFSQLCLLALFAENHSLDVKDCAKDSAAKTAERKAFYFALSLMIYLLTSEMQAKFSCVEELYETSFP